MELRPHLSALKALGAVWLASALAWSALARPATVRTSAGTTLHGDLGFQRNVAVVRTESGDTLEVPLEEWVEVLFDDASPAEGEGGDSGTADGGVLEPGAGQAPEGWGPAQVGSGPAGKVDQAGEVWTLTGGGTGLRANADASFLVQRRLDVSGQILARLEGFDGTARDAMAGLTLRDNVGEAAAYAFVGQNAASGLCFQYRQIAGGMTMRMTNVSFGLPAWLRLSRHGGSVVAEASPDGRQWQALGRANINLGQSIRAGMLVASGTEDSVATAQFRRASVGARGLGYLPASGYPRIRLRGGSLLVAPVESADESVIRLGGVLKGSLVSILNVARIEFVPLTPELEGRLEPERPGVLLIDGDFLEGTLRRMATNEVTVSSLLFGFRKFAAGNEAAAIQLGAPEEEEGGFEVLLKNGTAFRAQDLEVDAEVLRARSPLLGALVVDARAIRVVRRGAVER